MFSRLNVAEIVAAVIVMASVYVLLFVWSDATPELPVCTDLIADAGGSCQGEPLPPCPTEDADDCYWDAPTMGNGSGRSFITVDGTTTYTD
jgi:hypothetical protein